jgi:PD-(D/E)XK endonuclease
MLKTKPKPPPTPGGQIKNSKLRGEWAELRFMTRAAERGLMISKPWGDSARYDLMIEHHGRVLRIQVKSTMRIVRGCYRCHLPTPEACQPDTRAITKNCHPEATALSSPKDPGAPREASRTLRGNNSRVRRASKSEALLQNQIDFVAAYIIPLDLWYILPAPVTTRLHGHISLSPHRKGHKYEPYVEAWHLLL